MVISDMIWIGCAGWTIPKQHAPLFPPFGSHLERCAQRLTAVEINTSFYWSHRRSTYHRWAAAVPPGVAFAVKAPKMMTHELRLTGADSALEAFLAQASGLGDSARYCSNCRRALPRGLRTEFLLAATAQNLRKLAKLVPRTTHISPAS
jgi:Protein of unknown function DUF72